MYPKVFIDVFRNFDRTPEVFVAMPFSKKFEPRWVNIFKPAIQECKFKPFRVKENIVGDSIPGEILNGIGKAKIILVDISNQFQDEKRGFPNSNVMYELGLAHSVRLPEEVIIVRDKSSCQTLSPFDIRHIRWNEIPEKNANKSKQIIKSLLKNAENEIDFTKDLLVNKTLTKLDMDSISFLYAVRDYVNEGFDLYPFDPDRKGLYGLPNKACSEKYLRNIARNLIELGVLQSGEVIPFWQRVYGATCEYKFTLLGKAILSKIPKNLDEKLNRRNYQKWLKSKSTRMKIKLNSV